MNNTVESLVDRLHQGDFRALARAITFVENEVLGYETILKNLNPENQPKIIGITGPPGAGKSTLVNQLVNYWADKQGKRVAVVAVDPTSPFNFGSILGDRIRMQQQFNKPNVFIRSLATRGSLGGLSAKTIEIVETVKAAKFDYIIVETVGVGQSEVEIAGLADITLVVLVPEAGDEIQHIKSGLMEIADVFVLNKADREGADTFLNRLKMLMHHDNGKDDFPVLKTSAEKGIGIDELGEAIDAVNSQKNQERQKLLLLEKVWKLIAQKRMQDLDRHSIAEDMLKTQSEGKFNLYNFVSKY